MTKPYTLLVFDWEGTLNDSGAHMKASLALAMADLSLPAPDLNALIAHLGLDAQTLIDTVCHDQDSAIRARLVQHFRQHYFRQTRIFELFPEVKDELTQLKDAGYFLAVATGMGNQSLQLALEQTQLTDVFDATCTADQTRSKPDPMMLTIIMDRLGVLPADTLMIGDTVSDLQLAKNARVDAVAISHYHAVHPQLREHELVYCIENVTQLRLWLVGK